MSRGPGPAFQSQVVTSFFWGVAVFGAAWFLWKAGQRARLQHDIGPRAYSSLNQLAPRIDAPVIRVPVPGLLI